VDPAQFPQTLRERPKAHLRIRIVALVPVSAPDAPHALGLLRAHVERPRDSQTAHCIKKLPSSHIRHRSCPPPVMETVSYRLNER
jgi:hypothetical protein